ncbi:MAG: tRNA(His) guanylyltransferase Thg1 family protein [bacterium]
MDKTSLGNRMKSYESVSNIYLTPRMPLIIRIDGKAFHTYTRNFDKPYDNDFYTTMKLVCDDLITNISGAKLCYMQSDEISILITDYDKLETQAWFDKKLQKIVSVSASLATGYFNEYIRDIHKSKLSKNKIAFFDSRAFVLPKEEVCNYFIWRQQDAVRNSIQGLGQAYFSHKSLHKLNCNQIQDKLMLEKNINWNDIDTVFKRGYCVYKNTIDNGYVIDYEIPIFTQNRNYIEKHL